jgi:hypothetical protein
MNLAPDLLRDGNKGVRSDAGGDPRASARPAGGPAALPKAIRGTRNISARHRHHSPKGIRMQSPASTPVLLLALLAAPFAQAQELSPRMGFAAFLAQPSDTAGKLYGSGWKIDLTVHFRREEQVEGRLRLEFGEFREGKAVLDFPYSGTRYSAQTRLVGYDWLIPLGPKRAAGVDLILGIGGAHWKRRWNSYTLPGNPYPYFPYSEDEDQIAFAGTVGFRFRFNRTVELEIHQVLTSLPSVHRDFEDAELSHTALGLGVRF